MSETAATAAAAADIGASRVRRATTSSWVGLGIGVALVAWAVVTALGDDRAWQGKITDIAVFATMATTWNLLAGYTGLVSVGQQAYVGLGAYGLIVFANEVGLNIYLAIVPAAIVAVLTSIPIGFLAFRLRGGYFAIGTWVIAEIVRLVVKNNTSDVIGGGRGTSLVVPESAREDRLSNVALVAIVVLVVAVAAVYMILRSRIGLALRAVRDNEAGARGLGVDVYRTRFAIYVIAAFFTALAAGAYYVKNVNVQPDAAFSVSSWTAPIIVMVVFGGLGTIEGPIIGAIVYYLAQDTIQDREWMSDSSFLIATGVVALLFALFLKGGIWSSLTQRVPTLQVFPIRRRLEVPGVAHDRRGGAR